MEEILRPLAGLAVFLFSLRFLTRTIDESIANRISPYIRYIDKGIFLPIVTGIFTTFIFQASSITIITIMALVGRSILSLRSGIFMMMGATIGTAAKSWIFATETQNFGYLLLIGTSIALIFVKQHFKRQILDLFLSIGFMFLGWNMLISGHHLISSELIQDLLKIHHNYQFLTLFIAMGISFLVTIVVQSSSTVVLLLIGLAQAHEIPFLIGTAGILGANVGTCITQLFIAIEYHANVKRIAVAHFLIKMIGALMSLLLMKTFLNTLDYLFFGMLKEVDTAQQLSLVHIGFNIINVAMWILLNPILFKAVQKLVPDDSLKGHLWLSDPVRNLLQQVPSQAVIEAHKQWHKLKEKVKVIEDEVFNILLTGQYPEKNRDTSELHQHFRAIEEVLLGLLSRKDVRTEDISVMLSDFRYLRLIFDDIVALKIFIDSVPLSRLRIVCGLIKQPLIAIDDKRNELWTAIFLDEKARKTGKIQKFVLKNLEGQVLNVCKDTEDFSPQNITLTYNLTKKLLSCLQRLISFARQNRYFKT